MGWPIDDSYSKSSNIDDAHKLKGKLFLTLGEYDRNVDPASTYELVEALKNAEKDFEFHLIPKGGHGSGEKPYYRKLRAEFFEKHLMNKEAKKEFSKLN